MTIGAPLSDRHHTVGARFRQIAGREVPAGFGNFDAEYAALSTGTAILDRSHMGRIVATGSDALDLLNRFSTNETVGLADGDVVVTVLTSDIGRVIEVITVVRRSATESVFMTGAGAEEMVVEWLDRYNFGEDCELSVATGDSAQFTISGPSVAGLGVPLPEAGNAITIDIGGVAVEIVRITGPSLESYEILVENPASAGNVWDALVTAGATPAGEDAFNVVRVEHGLPARMSELSKDVNPLEAGLEPYVSFTKGCYMGQEVIARLDTYEKIQRRLVGLVSEASVPAGSPLRSGDREIGMVTSAVASPALGRAIALGYVRKAHAESGTKLDSDHGPVEVVQLPFAVIAAG